MKTPGQGALTCDVSDEESLVFDYQERLVWK